MRIPNKKTWPYQLPIESFNFESLERQLIEQGIHSALGIKNYIKETYGFRVLINIEGGTICFKNEQEAIAFKLIW